MADDPNIRGQQDRVRINVTQEHEVRYWCKRFDCSPEELKAAVERVGPDVLHVARALQQGKR